MRRQQIVETVHCDKCGEETTDPSTFTVEVRARGAPLRRTIDLCPADAPLVAELHEMLRHVAVDDRNPHVVTCPLCNDSFGWSGMSNHLVQGHGAAVVQPSKCPDCGTKTSSPTAMIAHRRHKHGYDHIAALAASVPSPTRKRRR